MNKYLIFRTDRIGDFLVSAILIKSIKRNDKKSYITVISSEKNYDYIKTFKFVDEVILLKNTFLQKIKLIFKLKQFYYKCIVLHDNKNRSNLISFFLKAKKKIKISKFSFFPQIDIIKKILNILNFNFNRYDLDILSDRKTNIFKNKYIVLHLDEKWFHQTYIENYTNIEPSKKDLLLFLKSLSSLSKKTIFVTTGITTPKLLNKVFKYKNYPNVFFYENLDIISLEKLILNADLLISCHGSVSHIASAFKKRQIDIIDSSYNYFLWTKHFRNYCYLYRENFKKLSKKILLEIK